MAGRLTLVAGLPGFDSLRRFAERFASSPGAVFTSSNSATLAQVRDYMQSHEAGLRNLEEGRIEIKPLGELIRVFAAQANLPMLPVAGLEHQKAIAGAAAQTLPDDSPLAAVKHLPGFHEALVLTFQELRRHRVPAHALETLPARQKETADLMRRFDSLLETHRLTTLSHRIERLTETSPVRPRELRRVFWAGETDLPPLWIEFLRWTLGSGAHLSLLVERHPANDTLFPLCARVQSAFPSAKVEMLGQTPPMAASLFGETPLDPGPGRVRVLEAADAVCETEWALRYAAEFLDSGGKPAEVCLYCRSLEDYAPLISAAAKRLGLSLHMARQERLLTNPFARHCLAALRACSSGSVAQAAGLVMGGYSEIPPERRREAAAAVRRCAGADDPWSELAEAGRDRDTPVPIWFGRMADWRTTALESDGTLADWLRALDRLMSQMPWLDDSLSLGSPTAERDGSAQDAMVRSLRVSLLASDSSQRFRFEAFVDHVERTWRDTAYWARDRGGLRVASSPKEIGPAEFVIGLGLVEGRFPRRRAEDPILLDRDRQRLREQNPAWDLPTSYEQAEEDRREFYRLVCSAPDLLLSRPRQISGHPEVPAAFLAEIEDAAPDTETIVRPLEQRFPRPVPGLPLADLLPAMEWWKEAAQGNEAEEWAGFLDGEAKEQRERFRRAADNARSDDIQDDALRAEVAELPRPLRLHHLASLNRCPFQYLAQAKIELRPARPRWAWDRLTAVVRRTDLVTPKTVDELRERLMKSLNEELAAMRGEAPKEELDLMAVAAPRLLQAFARREMAAREAWELVPVAQNKRLHEVGMRNSVPYGGGEVLLDETVDLVYRRGDDLVPLRLAYATKDHYRSEEFTFENGLLLALLPNPKEERVAVADSLQNGLRRALARRKTNRSSRLPERRHDGLYVDRKAESSMPVLQTAREHLNGLLDIASSGRVRPKPGDHCRLCGFGSLCRRAQFSQLGALGDDSENEP
ncbi:MAG: hypothetical protein IH851_04375 [Armatimonadetes bacterium]|nr:hypothetical protein [Armatimonadota bacterium]